MGRYKLTNIYKDGYLIKCYTNESNTRTICFHLFGRYSSYTSDTNSLDLAIGMIFFRYSELNNNPMATLNSYESSLEATVNINLSQVEAA